MRSLKDQQHSQPATFTVANAPENMRSRQEHSDLKKLPNINTMGDMLHPQQLGQPAFPGDPTTPQDMFNPQQYGQRTNLLGGNMTQGIFGQQQHDQLAFPTNVALDMIDLHKYSQHV